MNDYYISGYDQSIMIPLANKVQGHKNLWHTAVKTYHTITLQDSTA